MSFPLILLLACLYLAQGLQLKSQSKVLNHALKARNPAYRSITSCKHVNAMRDLTRPTYTSTFMAESANDENQSQNFDIAAWFNPNTRGIFSFPLHEASDSFITKSDSF